MVNAGNPPTAAGMEAAADAVAAALGSSAERHAPLGARTTYRVGGRASVLMVADSEDELARVHDALALVRDDSHDSGGCAVPLLVLGNGSNLVVADAGFPGLVVLLGSGLAGIEITGTTVRAGGAAQLPLVARRTAAAGLTGLEWAVGVPGTVGGALKMNAGGHGSDTAAVLVRQRIFDLVAGGGSEGEAERLELAYRHSSLTDGEVVVWAEFGLTPTPATEARAALADVVRWRRAHQPGGSNAGSVFRNPPGDSAGRLVEAAGLKGFRLGSAQVSGKHANFIQADEGGSADDVRRLIEHVRRVVRDSTGVRLEPEVRFVGFDQGEREKPSPSCGGSL
ncbi:MAG TPA: UDP-N-acetylmuramate dehydrogenase [Acidimicrobiales bacterium]|nr:UDP-N-acetylmuramate dehydrogenase [Acidimicrobiales bacterium]